MTVEDVAQVIQLGKGQKEFTFEHQSFWLKDQLSAWCQSENDVCLVAEVEGKIVGFSLYAMHVPTKKVTWENLYILPEMRKMGIASKLIEEGLNQVKEKGYAYIMGCVNASDKDGFVTYVEKFGFKKGHEMIWIDKVIK
ncbi:MAG: GNAT family N-acetyltransferase [Patescibacteria group bacterium]